MFEIIAAKNIVHPTLHIAALDIRQRVYTRIN